MKPRPLSLPPGAGIALVVGVARSAAPTTTIQMEIPAYDRFGTWRDMIVCKEVMITMPEKRSLSVDKQHWHPSPLLGQIVLITTCNADGSSNIAPKSWISMMAFDPPLLALGCNRQHWTGRNILERQMFVVNVPGAELAATIWAISQLPHPRPVEAAGLTPIPALIVTPPRIVECHAHLECRLVDHLSYGDELVLLGQIEALSVDEELIMAPDPYAALRMLVFLEQQTYGVVEYAQRLAPHGSTSA